MPYPGSSSRVWTRYIGILTVEGTSIPDASIVWAFLQMGGLHAWVGEGVVATVPGVAVGCVAAIHGLGLRSEPFSEREKEATRRGTRDLFPSLAAMPMAHALETPAPRR